VTAPAESLPPGAIEKARVAAQEILGPDVPVVVIAWTPGEGMAFAPAFSFAQLVPREAVAHLLHVAAELAVNVARMPFAKFPIVQQVFADELTLALERQGTKPEEEVPTAS